MHEPTLFLAVVQVPVENFCNILLLLLSLVFFYRKVAYTQPTTEAEILAVIANTDFLSLAPSQLQRFSATQGVSFTALVETHNHLNSITVFTVHAN